MKRFFAHFWCASNPRSTSLKVFKAVGHTPKQNQVLNQTGRENKKKKESRKGLKIFITDSKRRGTQLFSRWAEIGSGSKFRAGELLVSPLSERFLAPGPPQIFSALVSYREKVSELFCCIYFWVELPQYL